MRQARNCRERHKSAFYLNYFYILTGSLFSAHAVAAGRKIPGSQPLRIVHSNPKLEVTSSLFSKCGNCGKMLNEASNFGSALDFFFFFFFISPPSKSCQTSAPEPIHLNTG